MATTGAKLPASGTSVARSTATAWTNPSNITANDGTTASISSGSTGSAYLVASNFGFSIPTGSLIQGVTVIFEAAESATGSESTTAQLQDASAALFGTTISVTINGTALTNYTYGGSANLWGATLTPAIINDVDFGVRFWFTTTHAMTVDTVTMEITYQPPSTGSLIVSETGSDTFASTGDVIVKGSLSVSETGADTIDAQGAATSAIVGDLHGTESGSDTFASSAKVIVKGSLAATEAADTFAASGTVKVQGSLSASETGSDTIDAQGSALDNDTVGDLHGYESGADTFASSAKVIVQGGLSISESGNDTIFFGGEVYVSGTLAVTEAGSDTFEATGYEVNFGALAATEARDVMAAAGYSFSQYPDPSQVLAGVHYGPDGSYVGTATAGGGGMILMRRR